MNSRPGARTAPYVWFALVAAAFGAWLLAPVLAPFALAALLAYLLAPAVEVLARRGLPRPLAASALLFVALAALSALALVLVPTFLREFARLAERLPGFVERMNELLVPWLRQHLGVEVALDADAVRVLAARLVSGREEAIVGLVGALGQRGLAFAATLLNLLLVPLVLYYLLRDWNTLLERLEALVPRPWHARVIAFAREADAALAGFLRGQLLVVAVMMLYYPLALGLAGLEFALSVGLVTGLLVVIPYVGALVGLALATLAALAQFGPGSGLLWVWAAFAIGQTLEGWILVPKILGQRIGLHPVVAIFALVAFGELLGVFGVLVALPAAAVFIVALRQLERAYRAGAFYRGDG